MSKSKPWWAFWKKDAPPQAPQTQSQQSPRQATDLDSTQDLMADDLNSTIDIKPYSSGGDTQKKTAKKKSKKPPWWAFWRKKDPNLYDTADLDVPDDSTDPLLRAAPDSKKKKKKKKPAKPKKPAAKPKGAPPEKDKGKASTESEKTDAAQANGQDPPTKPGKKIAQPIAATPAGPDSAFYTLFFLLLIAFSMPLWLTPWLPMQDLGARLGLLSVLQHKGAAASYLTYRPYLYAGSLPYYALHYLSVWLSPQQAIKLLLQLYLLLAPLSLLYLLQSTKQSRWNVLFGFFFLYNNAFTEGNLEFLFALPLLLFGFGCLYGWIVRDRAFAGLGLMATPWLLLAVDPYAYIVFIVVAVVMAAFLTLSFGEWFGNVMLLGLSLVGAAPWVYFLALEGKPIPGLHKGAALFTAPPFATRVQELLGLVGHTVRGSIEIWLLGGVCALVVIGIIGRFRQAANHKLRLGIRFYHVFLFCIFLGGTLLLPGTFMGKPLSATPLLVLAGLSLTGWPHLRPGNLLGYVLISITTIGGLATATILADHFSRAQEPHNQLHAVLKRIPPNQKLLVWQLGQSKLTHTHFDQIGGFYMHRTGGMSNLRLAPLGWTTVHLKPKRRLPDPARKRLPSLLGWDFLLTARPIPKAKQTLVALYAKEKRFRLYRIRKEAVEQASIHHRTKDNTNTANTYFTRTCMAGKASSCRGLGILFQDGQGVKRDLTVASYYFKKACTLQDGPGCRLLGNLLTKAKDNKTKAQDAFQAFHKACAFNDALGCLQLGNLYQFGRGTTTDCTQANESYQKACKLGNTGACNMKCN